MLKLEQGRPADTSGRQEKEIRVYDFLDKLGVIYDRVDHEALMIVGDKRLVTKDVSKKLGTSRLSFASESYMEEYLDITPGSVSVLGLMNDTERRVTLALERRVAEAEWFGCHPCRNTSSLRLKTKDLLHVFLPHIGVTPIIVDL